MIFCLEYRLSVRPSRKFIEQYQTESTVMAKAKTSEKSPESRKTSNRQNQSINTQAKLDAAIMNEDDAWK